MTRFFEQAPSYKQDNVTLPTRGSKHSAGYDFYASEDIELKPFSVSHTPIMHNTGVTAHMNTDEVLKIYPRSSMAIKQGLALANGVGIIDSDYYPNSIGLALVNHSNETLHIKKGTRIAQGIFVKYLTTNDDDANNTRNGGFGSTGE